MSEATPAQVQNFPWLPTHDEVVRESLLRGIPYSAIARRLSRETGHMLSRNAVIGRASRLGLVGAADPPSARVREGRVAVLRDKISLAPVPVRRVVL